MLHNAKIQSERATVGQIPRSMQDLWQANLPLHMIEPWQPWKLTFFFKADFEKLITFLNNCMDAIIPGSDIYAWNSN